MQMLGRYRIEALVGEGAMADVFRAHDPDIGRTLAVKVLKPEYRRDPDIAQRFLREARAAGALNHPHIVSIYDVGEADGVPYIAMELVDGRPLDLVLQAGGRMAYERVLMIGKQLAEALAYAHGRGVVHRDVKPSNILLSADGQSAKLLDFGVARLGEGEGAGQLARTQFGQIIGTPRYMSPEQALGRPVDQRSDLFSLGVVLYEMLTGKVAFDGAGMATLALQIAQERVDPIERAAADCPPGLRFVIDKLLAKKPDARFADGAALAAALDRELQSVRAEKPARSRGLPLRVKLPLVLVTVTAAALLASVWAVLGREQRTLEHMAIVSGDSIAAFVTNNAAVLAADNAGLAPAQQDWTSLQAFVTNAGHDAGVRDILVADSAGVIRAASDPTIVGRRYRPIAGETVIASETGAAVTAARPTAQGEGLRFVRPIRYAGATFGTVDLVLRRSALDEAIADSQLLLYALAGVVMLAVLLIGFVGGASVSRPLRRLRQALEDAPGCDFALQISHARRDEFGQAFDAFNRAAAAVEPRLAGSAADVEAAMVATRIEPAALGRKAA